MRTSNLKYRLMILFCLLAASGNLIGADFNITNYGAVSGKLSTGSIQKAIDACHANGGGRVVIPSGTFISGSIVLKSNVNLHLDPGAELSGSVNIQDYKTGAYFQGLIYCEDAINVSISGSGIINGNGTTFYKTDKTQGSAEFDKSVIRQKEKYMPEGTFFTDGPLERISNPGMTIVFFNCTKVSITGITIKDTPFWATRFGYCDDLLIQGITILNNPLVPNNDGIHCSTSRNIRISDCHIVAGDDAIVITGFSKDTEVEGYNSKEQENCTYGNKTIYAENVTVSNCQLKSSSVGIRIGYGQHPIRRCTFSNIVIYDSHRGIGIFAHDASSIEDLIFSDFIIETRLFNGQWWGHGEPVHLSAISRFPGKLAGQIKNVQFNTINAIAEQGILLYGLKESTLENIQFNNFQLRMRKGKETMDYAGNFDLRPVYEPAMKMFEHDIPGLYAQYVTNLSIQNFDLTWGNDLPSFFTHGIECEHVKGLRIDGFNGSGNPNSKGSKKVKLFETTILKD